MRQKTFDKLYDIIDKKIRTEIQKENCTSNERFRNIESQINNIEGALNLLNPIIRKIDLENDIKQYEKRLESARKELSDLEK
jgi:hypothetical protein